MVEIGKIKLTQIQKASYNPRIISEENKKKLENSIRNFGLVEPIVINLKNNTIISGHQRYDILTDMELLDGNLAEQEYNLVKYGDYGLVLTEDEPLLPNEDYEKALNITLNNTNLTGKYDFEQLSSLFKELEFNGFDVELTGFDGLEDIDFNLEGFDFEPDGEGYLETEFNDNVEEDNFEVGEDIEVTVKHGDLFQLGNHYLLCGDATIESDVIKLISASGERERALI